MLKKQSPKPKPSGKQMGLGCAIVISVLLLTVGLTIALGTGSHPNTTQTSPSYSGPEVEYVITGTAVAVDVTLGNATGGTEQFSDVRLFHSSNRPGYKYSYDSFPSHFLYISAQNQGETGSVTVTIYVKGQIFKTSTSVGAYVIATASGYK